MAEPAPPSNDSTSRDEFIRLYHLTSGQNIDVKALKSDSEQNTITETFASSLGHRENSTSDLRWRTTAFGKVWTDTFEVVRDPTTVGGVTYNVVLSAQASEKLLRAKAGTYIALAKGSKSKSKGASIPLMAQELALTL